MASILLLRVIAFTTPFSNLRGAFQQPTTFCVPPGKTKKAAGEFLRPVRAQIANAADSRPPVRHFWLCIQLTIILTTMPA
ncbi:TPA: hypothetical protein ACU9Q8_003295, partial [Klebsiella aerogenes]